MSNRISLARNSIGIDKTEKMKNELQFFKDQFSGKAPTGIISAGILPKMNHYESLLLQHLLLLGDPNLN